MKKICLLVALFAWFAMLGITDHYLPWVSWHGEVMACVALFFLWLSLIFQRPKVLKVSIPVTAYFFLIIGGGVTIQALCGQMLFLSDLFLGWLNIALIVLSVCLGFYYAKISHRSSCGGIDAFATVILATAFVLAVQAMVRALDLDFMTDWIVGVGAKRRPGSNLSQPNHLATFLNWGVVCLTYLHFKGRVRVFFFYFALSLLAFGLVLAESRTGLLSFTCICAVLAYMRVDGRAVKSLGLLVAWCATCISFVWWPDIWNFIQIIDVAPPGINVNSSGRIELWLQTLRAIAIHPFIGWGYRQFAWAHMSTLADVDSAIVATYSHNLILDLLVWFGLPFGSLLTLLMFRWICNQVMCSRTLEQKIALLFLLPFGIHTMLEFPHMYLYFLIPVSLSIGALSAFQVAAPKIQLPSRVFHGIYVVVFLLATWSVYEYFLLEEDFRLARFASARVGSDPINYQKSNTYLLNQVADLVDVVRQTPIDGMETEDIEQARRVAIYYPWLGTLSKYAMILSMNGRNDEYIYYSRIIRTYFGEGAFLRLEEKVEVLRNPALVHR